MPHQPRSAALGLRAQLSQQRERDKVWEVGAGQATDRMQDHGMPAPVAPIVLQLRVVLRGISPLIWRRILVRSDNTIADLHATLQLALGWSDDHLHRFVIHGRASRPVPGTNLATCRVLPEILKLARDRAGGQRGPIAPGSLPPWPASTTTTAGRTASTGTALERATTSPPSDSEAWTS